MDRSSPASPIEVGVIIKPHGVKGVVKVHLYNKESCALEGCERLTLSVGQQQREVAVTHLGSSGADQLLHIEGVDDREGAEALRGARLRIDRLALEPLEEGQYYYVDLIGCQVFDEQERLLGEVSQLFPAGEMEVMVVQGAEGERMIPMADQWVTVVDVEARRIVVAGADQWEPQE